MHITAQLKANEGAPGFEYDLIFLFSPYCLVYLAKHRRGVVINIVFDFPEMKRGGQSKP